MTTFTVKEFFIQGITHEGKVFRPSDWAERLAGVMSQFRPGDPRVSVAHNLNHKSSLKPALNPTKTTKICTVPLKKHGRTIFGNNAG